MSATKKGYDTGGAGMSGSWRCGGRTETYLSSGCVAIARRSSLPHVASHLPTEPARCRQEEGARREEEETEGKQIKIQ